MPDIALGHTAKLLEWFALVGVDRYDVALKNVVKKTMMHPDQQKQLAGLTTGDITGKLLLFLRGRNAGVENEQPADPHNIYIRPARFNKDGETKRSWPVVFLDFDHDKAEEKARELIKHTAGIVIETSPGHYHVWIQASRALSEEERKAVQSALMVTHHSDPGSVSGEHLGRLPGFQNRNPDRGSAWVNYKWISKPSEKKPPLDVDKILAGVAPAIPTPGRGGAPVECPPRGHKTASPTPKPAERIGTDQSPSGLDWRTCCEAFECAIVAELPPETIAKKIEFLVDVLRQEAASNPHHANNPEQYARRTAVLALDHVLKSHGQEWAANHAEWVMAFRLKYGRWIKG